MTVTVDWTLIDRPRIRLTLAHSQGGYYSVTDQDGRLFFPPTRNLETCIRFMTAMAVKKDALIDEASIERASGHSVRVPDNVYPIRKGA